MELRQRKRYPVRMLVAYFAGEGEKGIGLIRNFSLQGLFIQTDRPISQSKMVHLDILKRHQALESRRVCGRVVHQQRDGFGVILTDGNDFSRPQA